MVAIGSVMSETIGALLCSPRKHDCARTPIYHRAMPSHAALALAENTNRLMRERGWTQRELAKRSGISQSGIGFVLRYHDRHDRHAALDTVEALAKAFRVTALDLLARPSATVLAHPARNVHNAHQRAASIEAPNSEHAQGELDVPLLQLIITQVDTLPGLDAEGRAAVVAKAYAAFCDGAKRPTKSAVLKLVRVA